MIEKITHEGRVFAMILRNDSRPEETEFFTPQEFPLQLGFLKYQSDTVVKPHTHKPFNNAVNKRQEVLLIQNGKVEATFYTCKGEKISSNVLNRGDILFLAEGGHGFKILEDAEIIEVKQGPYEGVIKDKKDLDL